jgi:hypothetical protein
MSAVFAQSAPSRVLVDANFLVALLSADEKEDAGAKARYLVKLLSQRKGTLIVPTPVIAEYLVGADEAGINSLNVFERQAHIALAVFDRTAAFECAMLDRAAILGPNGDKKDGSEEPWQKIKVDRQVVAIGKVHGAQLAISQDKGVRTAALRSGMQACTIEDLPFDPDEAQKELALPEPKSKTKKSGKPKE